MTTPPPSSPLFCKREALLRLAAAVRETGYHFVTVSPATHARVNARPDACWAKDLRGVLGWSQPFRPSASSPSIFSLMQEADVLRPYRDGWRSLVRFSTLSGELFAHSAYPTEAADAVFFGPDTYRFARAIDAHLAQREAPVRRAVDIGCGAGAGAILIARAHPEAEVRAGDINAAALRLTEVNSALARTCNVTVCESDVLAGVEGRFDLIVSNPPYLNDSAGRAYRHGGGPLGADLSLAILGAAARRLAPGGTLLLYTGVAIVDGIDRFLADAEALLAGSNLAWRYGEIDPDVFGEELSNPAYAQADRIAAVLLTATAPRREEEA